MMAPPIGCRSPSARRGRWRRGAPVPRHRRRSVRVLKLQQLPIQLLLAEEDRLHIAEGQSEAAQLDLVARQLPEGGVVFVEQALAKPLLGVIARIVVKLEEAVAHG